MLFAFFPPKMASLHCAVKIEGGRMVAERPVRRLGSR